MTSAIIPSGVTTDTSNATSLAANQLTPEEQSLLTHLAEAIEQAVCVLVRETAGDTTSEEPAFWRYAEPAALVGKQWAQLAVDESLLGSALASNAAVLSAASDSPTVAAVRLSSRAVMVTAAESAGEWVVRVLNTAIAHRAAVADAEQLFEENDAFATQLASDLEELYFLRSMVQRLSASRPDSQLSELAGDTLPVLNATVHTRCLAFLETPNENDPYEVVAVSVDGSAPLTNRVLRQVVAELGPTAISGTIVRNWPTTPTAHGADRAEQIDGIDALVLSPLSSGGRHFGWLVAANRDSKRSSGVNSPWQLAGDEFGSGEATLIATTASILATHAANLEMLREKEQLMVSVVRTLVSAIESKDRYTRGHSERVALYARRIAIEVGYGESEAENLYLTALLHDVGKIGVRDAVLQKAGKLTDEEFAEIARHPDEGWAILSGLRPMAYVLPGVLHHHERWDGNGYPDGRAAEDIPSDGRVLAVADAYDAMTSDRAYRKGMPEEKAESILRDGAGSQWDPTCVQAFFACLDDIHQIKRDYVIPERVVRQPSED